MDDLRERLIFLIFNPVSDDVEAIADSYLEEILTTHTITPIREPEHGTLYRYVDRKCRCDECRAANAAYSREYRAGMRREAGKNG